ncbi:MAG: hypothetical protein ACLRX4_09710 [Oscillospiraceae bacterium]
MTFDAGTWWLAVLLLGFVTAGLVYLLKRSLFGRIDKLDESMKEISENSVKKSDYESTVQSLQADIKQIRADYTPAPSTGRIWTSAVGTSSRSKRTTSLRRTSSGSRLRQTGSSTGSWIYCWK